MYIILFFIFFFLLGSIVGSFLNVVIYRLETNEKISKGRSHCRDCRKDLLWHDLVPIVSFLRLKGRCRNCGNKISMQYPLVEAGTGIMFALVFYLFIRPYLGGNFLLSNFNFESLFPIIYYLYIVSALIVIFVYDLKHYIIPDEAVYTAIAITLFYRIIFSDAGRAGGLLASSFPILNFGVINYLLAALLAGGFFLMIVLLTKGEGMGGGDVKLAFLMGLVLGIDKVLISLAFAFTLGAVIGIILIILKKKTMKSAIPFGPFLVIGTIAGLFL